MWGSGAPFGGIPVDRSMDMTPLSSWSRYSDSYSEQRRAEKKRSYAAFLSGITLSPCVDTLTSQIGHRGKKRVVKASSEGNLYGEFDFNSTSSSGAGNHLDSSASSSSASHQPLSVSRSASESDALFRLGRQNKSSQKCLEDYFSVNRFQSHAVCKCKPGTYCYCNTGGAPPGSQSIPGQQQQLQQRGLVLGPGQGYGLGRDSPMVPAPAPRLRSSSSLDSHFRDDSDRGMDRGMLGFTVPITTLMRSQSASGMLGYGHGQGHPPTGAMEHHSFIPVSSSSHGATTGQGQGQGMGMGMGMGMQMSSQGYHGEERDRDMEGYIEGGEFSQTIQGSPMQMQMYSQSQSQSQSQSPPGFGYVSPVSHGHGLDISQPMALNLNPSLIAVTSSLLPPCPGCMKERAMFFGTPAEPYHQCHYCMKSVCDGCITSCERCCEVFCRFCSTSNFSGAFMQTLCIDCDRGAN